MLQVLHTALELLMDAAPVEVHDAAPRRGELVRVGYGILGSSNLGLWRV